MDPSPASEQLVRTLANDLMSPYCPGRTIASCPSPQARKLEDQMLAQAENGATREAIEASLVGRFGEDIVGYRGDPIVVYGSFAAALAAAATLAWLGRRWVRTNRFRAPASTSAAPSRSAAAAEIDALDDALDEIDEF